MNKRPTRKDVARLARVSVATVSYVINNSPSKISPETRQRVLDAVRKLGFRPDAIARSLKTGYTKTIGIIIPTIASPGMAMMTNVVQEVMMEEDYFVIVASTRERQYLEEKMVELMISQSVDGLVVCPVGTRPYDQLRRLEAEKIPLVFMDRCIPDYTADLVMTNNIQAARQAGEYLVQRGCRNVLCISFSDTASSARDRLEGCRLGFRGAGIPDEAVKNLTVEDPTGLRAEAAFLSFMDQFGLPDGILCTTEEIGVCIVKAFHQRRINFPPQNIVIFDADWAEMLNPPLPTISQNFFEIGRTAARLLLERLSGSSKPSQSFYIDAQLTF